MIDHRLTLTLEGLPADKGSVPLSDFVRQLQLLQSALGRIDRSLAPGGKSATIFRVADLGHSSPARVVLEAVPRPKSPDLGAAILVTLFSSLEDVERGDRRSRTVDFELLEDFKDLSAPVGEKLQTVQLSQNGHTFAMTSGFHRKVEALLETSRFGVGFLRGMLEAINVHSGANTFKVYPAIGPKAVTCHFPAHLTREAIAAVGCYVEVRGTMKYRAEQPFAHEIDVTQVAGLETGEPVTWDDLHGIAPDLTGGLSSEDWVRARRELLEDQFAALVGAAPAA